jgi:hypothetical protein
MNFSGVVQGKYVEMISLIEKHKVVSCESVDDVVLYDIIDFSRNNIDRQYELFVLHLFGVDKIVLLDEDLLSTECFFCSGNIKIFFSEFGFRFYIDKRKIRWY